MRDAGNARLGVLFRHPQGQRAPAATELENALSVGKLGSFEGTVKTVRWFTVGHTLGDVATLLRYYLVPIDRDAIYLLRAQATEDSAPAMFGAADFVARSLRPRF